MFESVWVRNWTINGILVSEQQNDLNNGFHSPFTRCAASNNFFLVGQMLSILTQEELNWKTKEGNTALMWAVANTNSRMAIKILQNDKIQVDLLDRHQKTALHFAIAKGWDHHTTDYNSDELPQSEVIKELVKRADVNIQDANGNTPLHIAVMRRDFECIELLLSSGARVDVLNKEQKKPIDMLDIEHSFLFNFLQNYAVIFTLKEQQRNNNRDKVLALLVSQMPLHSAEALIEKHEDKHSSASLNDNHDASTEASACLLFQKKPEPVSSFFSSAAPPICSENKDDYAMLKGLWNLLMMILLLPLILKYTCQIDFFFELNEAAEDDLCPAFEKCY